MPYMCQKLPYNMKIFKVREDTNYYYKYARKQEWGKEQNNGI